MTMFFTNEVSIPFEGMHDVMRAYPDYNLVTLSGKEAVANNQFYAPNIYEQHLLSICINLL